MAVIINANPETESLTYEQLASGATEYSSRYEYPKVEKTTLVDNPFVITHFDVRDAVGDEGQRREYAVVEIVLSNGQGAVFTDGGAAILPALREAILPMLVRRGLSLGRNGKTWRLQG